MSAALFSGTACLSPQETRYETTDTATKIEVRRAPPGTKKVKVALVNFRNQTGRSFLVSPATAQLTTMMIRSGYFDIIEPSFVESVVKNQGQLSPEKLTELNERFGAEYFLTGTLTNFEIRRAESGFCLILPFLGSNQQSDYIVETGIDFRMVTAPEGSIAVADVVENRRTDTSESAAVLFFAQGQSTKVLQSSGGTLLRYAMRDMVEKLIDSLPAQ
ncbi:MAG: CsgG/HfaB family protein [bacterium]|nr:CsgG/HfaB family protein [bacterium]